MNATNLFAVYCTWDTTASVPGGAILSLHRTREGAEKAQAVAVATEKARQDKPGITKAKAIAIVTEAYGYYYPHMYDAVLSVMHRAQHAYEVQEVADEVSLPSGTFRRSEKMPLHD